MRYYGFGNETSNDGPDEIYQISLYQFTLFPALTFSRGAKGRFLVGPELRYASSNGTDPGTILEEESPVGFGQYGQLGVRAEARYDSRFDKDVFDSGVEFRLKTVHYPEVWDVAKSYGYVDGELGVHVPIGSRLFVSTFVGGKKVWGDSFPFFDAAYIGGHHTTAGYNWNRFAGDGSLYGIADFKIIVHQFRKFVPGELGLIVEAGRGPRVARRRILDQVAPFVCGRRVLRPVQPGSALRSRGRP